MADYEGYLLLHEGAQHADPLYFELGGGLLQYYSKKNGKWLGQFSLTRHRVVARPVKSGPSPNRFMVELCPVRSVHDTERSMTQFKRQTIILSASTPRLVDEWMRALYAWRRRNWKEGVVFSDHEDEFAVLRMMMHMYRLELRITRDLDMTIRKVTMTPEEPEEQDNADGNKHHSWMTPRTRSMLNRVSRWNFCNPQSTKNSSIL
ncbi:hypothetical protein Poli38472_002241 [Pythium oligandrum]|uniref:PH domain-containing protein n=1 Tax=Pythium oligandrum TaxID=41045 RepID=A0A8K1FGY5_PYTOL|nr:hypothetical protein Poli38472_002241 [Pythium oligandrum]|eukprot:TMW63300.1 hypothetical protein Poli38472_002241 [Pythium oligandrum]